MPKHAARTALPEGVEPLLTVAETAAVLCVADATLYRWLADPRLSLKDIAIHLPSGRRRFPADKLRAWIESQGRTRPEGQDSHA